MNGKRSQSTVYNLKLMKFLSNWQIQTIFLMVLIIPGSVLMIKKSAFKGWKSLEDVSIQPSTKIGNGFFNGCPKINNDKEKESKPFKKKFKIAVPVTPVPADSSICPHPRAPRFFSAKKWFFFLIISLL